MAKGGIHDQIGCGFARYSATADWSLPHFEKMLYDNAQLLSVYLDAWLVTRNQLLLDTAVDTADYLCDDALKNPPGGFFSSEGADSLYRKTDGEKRGRIFTISEAICLVLTPYRGCILRLDKKRVGRDPWSPGGIYLRKVLERPSRWKCRSGRRRPRRIHSPECSLSCCFNRTTGPGLWYGHA